MPPASVGVQVLLNLGPPLCEVKHLSVRLQASAGPLSAWLQALQGAVLHDKQQLTAPAAYRLA